MKLAIIADDFTGSNDTGVQFAKKGLCTTVTTLINNLSEPLLNSEVLVFNLESRFDRQETAYEKCRSLAEMLRNHGIKLLYKKIDSTFRGNIGAELAGIIDGSGIDCLFLIPALPSNGRITQNGDVLVNNQYLHETEFAKDPKTPVTKSYIPAIIAEQTDKEVHVFHKNDIPSDPDNFRGLIRKLKKDGKEIFVFDAKNNAELKGLADIIRTLEDEFLLAGTAGLAEFIPQSFGLIDDKPVLAIIGSVSQVSRSQILYAVDNRKVKIINFDINAVTDPNIVGKTADLVIENLKQGINTALYSAPEKRDFDKSKELANRMNIPPIEISDLIAKRMGECTSLILDKTSTLISGLFITGGDTLMKIADCLNIPGMTIQSEVLPAIPIGFLIHDKYKHVKVVTKAGSFGSLDALDKIIDFIRNN